MLKRDIPDRDEMAEQLQTIERESKRCGELVKNLLTFSRQTPSQREPNDLNTIVSRAVLLVKHKLEMQNIELVERLRRRSAAGGLRRQSDPAGGAGADGERVGGDAHGRPPGVDHRVRRRYRRSGPCA